MKIILLVDDEHAIVDALTGILEDEGYRVVAAANGKEGLARLADSHPDVVLVDVMMPIMGGREMLAAMKAHEEWRTVPVVMMSAVPLAVLQHDPGGPLAFSAFVQKPFDLELLLSTLHTLAARREGP